MNSMKVSAMDDLNEVDDFKTLARVIDALPELFNISELRGIKDNYAEFAEKHARDCAEGRLDVEDPESIREEASQMDDVGESLGVDTQAAQETIRNYATKKEQESEAEVDWDSDDDRRSSGDSSDNCSDGELDSMFGTLAARLRKPIFGLNCARPENTASGDRYQ